MPNIDIQAKVWGKRIGKSVVEGESARTGGGKEHPVVSRLLALPMAQQQVDPCLCPIYIRKPAPNYSPSVSSPSRPSFLSRRPPPKTERVEVCPCSCVPYTASSPSDCFHRPSRYLGLNLRLGTSMFRYCLVRFPNQSKRGSTSPSRDAPLSLRSRLEHYHNEVYTTQFNFKECRLPLLYHLRSPK